MGSEFMKRDDEIMILQSLKGDTYFNQFFKDEDFRTLIYVPNI